MTVNWRMIDFHILVDNKREYWESDLLEALDEWDQLQYDIIPSRLDMPKSRKYTRHWVGGAGTKALDPQYAVDIDRWANDIRTSTEARMKKIVHAAAREAAREMVHTGITNVMHARGQGDPKARTAMGRVFGSTQAAEDTLEGVLGPLRMVVSDAAKRQSLRVLQRIKEMDEEGASMSAIQQEVRNLIGTRSSWRQGLSTFLTTSLGEGGQQAAYHQAGDLVIGTWHTREDEKVRRTHRAVDGQVRVVGKRFRVGKSWMLRPGDPAGGIEETINCRCGMSYDINPAMAHLYDRYAG